VASEAPLERKYSRCGQANMTIRTFGQLSDKLLEVILLLIGLYVIQVLLLFTLPLVSDDSIRMTLILNSAWIGNTIFGLTIYWLTREKGQIAIAIGLLSVVLPVYGPIFYILTKFENTKG
jgi:apolipoprotein N-acyltransferase